MATRAEYNTCMRPHITGKGKTPEQRKLDFCVGAKICAKGMSKEEAIRVCSLPKEPKKNKNPSRRASKAVSCEKETIQVAECMLNKIDFKQAMNPNSFQQEVANALVECQCQ